MKSLVLASLLLCLALPAPGAGEGLSGVWFLNARGTGGDDDRQRLAVGGEDGKPPAARDEVCLGWVWSEPRPDIDPYPDAAPGVFHRPEIRWSLTADGATVEPASCRPPAAEVPFPRLGIGPAGELWLLEPAEQRSAWADLLHAVEAAYRQSIPPPAEGASPLDEMTVGALGRCAIRSLPVDPRTRLDRWLPLELPGHARPSVAGGDLYIATETGDDRTSTGQAAAETEMVRVRRFLRWVAPDCLADGEIGTLRLFPLPSPADDPPGGPPGGGTEGEDNGDGHFLTVAEVEWQRLELFELDPEDWSPGIRRLAAARSAAGGAEGVPATLRLGPEERQQVGGPPFDLCRLESLGELCRHNERARRQLYTAIPDPQADPSWPAERLAAIQGACAAALGGHTAGGDGGAEEARDACATATLWRRPLAGPLVAGFRGERVISRQPLIRETWDGDELEWRLETDAGNLLAAFAQVSELRVDLLDGSRPTIAVETSMGETSPDAARGSQTSPRASQGTWQAWGIGLAIALSVLASLLALRALSRSPPAPPPKPSPEALERRIEEIVERRVAAILDDPSVIAPRVDARLESAVGDAGGGIEERAAELRAELDADLRQRSETLRQELAAGVEGHQRTLRCEAQSLSEGLHRDLESLPAGFETLRCEIGELEPEERQRLGAALEAAGRLGDWIDRLWLPLEKRVLPDLPETANREWRQAEQTLRRFALEAVTLRRLARMAAGAPGGTPPSAAETAWLDDSGLLGRRPLPERLQRYLEPFDHPGRLGEVTLALQYLLEAYPVEQLPADGRSELHRELGSALRDARLEEDFHRLVETAAAGIGLRYRPLCYYKSRIDHRDCAFARQQVSPISLTERVGFAAATEPTVIVRLERPFFFQLDSGVYYAGHAHVARG